MSFDKRGLFTVGRYIATIFSLFIALPSLPHLRSNPKQNLRIISVDSRNIDFVEYRSESVTSKIEKNHN